MYKVGIVKSNGEIKSQNFETKQQADDYILSMAEKGKIKTAIILNKETKEREVIKF